jgi:hypothetical protein
MGRSITLGLLLGACLALFCFTGSPAKVDAGCKCQYRSKHVSRGKQRRMARHCRSSATLQYNYDGGGTQYDSSVQPLGDTSQFSCRGGRCVLKSRTTAPMAVVPEAPAASDVSTPPAEPITPPPPKEEAKEEATGNKMAAIDLFKLRIDCHTDRLRTIFRESISAASLAMLPPVSQPTMDADAPEHIAILEDGSAAPEYASN